MEHVQTLAQSEPSESIGLTKIVDYLLAPLAPLEEDPFRNQWIQPEAERLLFPPEDLRGDLRTYLVVDAVMYTQTGRYLTADLECSGLTWRCLYKGVSAQMMERAAPYLVDLTVTDYEDPIQTRFHRQFFGQQLQYTAGIFIQSTADFDTLYTQWRKFTLIKYHEEKNWVYFRFYDPRLLIKTLSCCNESDLNILMHQTDYLWRFSNEQELRLESITVESDLTMTTPKEAFLSTVFFEKLINQQEDDFVARAMLVLKSLPENLYLKEMEPFIRNYAKKAEALGLTIERAVLSYLSSCWLLASPEIEWEKVIADKMAQFQLGQALKAEKTLEFCIEYYNYKKEYHG